MQQVAGEPVLVAVFLLTMVISKQVRTATYQSFFVLNMLCRLRKQAGATKA